MTVVVSSSDQQPVFIPKTRMQNPFNIPVTTFVDVLVKLSVTCGMVEVVVSVEVVKVNAVDVARVMVV